MNRRKKIADEQPPEEVFAPKDFIENIPDEHTPFDDLAEREDWSIDEILERLSPMEEYVLRRRFGLPVGRGTKPPATFTEIAKEIHRTCERVRQITESAYRHAREILKANNMKVKPEK